MSSWSYLTRFVAEDDKIYFSRLAGPAIPDGSQPGYPSLDALENDEGRKLVTIKQLLSPVPVQDNEIICIGTNYQKHAEEANLTVPPHPVMWYKPRRSLADPGDIPIPSVVQTAFLDFEGELVIVTSKDARDVSVESASDYILGYTIGNDLTARMFQDPKNAGGQFTRAKAFDKFAPLGPVLVSAKAFGGLDGKTIRTRVNGRVFQDSSLDLIHGPAKLISFLSQGTTLPAGTAIMTGTPPGIGFFQEPKYSLKDGDEVEIEITGIGSLTNKMVYE